MWSTALRQNLASNVARSNGFLRMFPSAAFAKFERNKPHLNVGTVGKSKSDANSTFLMLFQTIINTLF